MKENYLSKRVTRLNDLLISSQDKWSEKLGISSHDYNLFLTIQENPGCTQLFLAKKRQVERSLLTRLITKYSEMGFIERRQNDHNKSAYALYLTESGEKLTAEIRDRISTLNEQLATMYTDVEYAAFKQFLDIAIKALEE